MGGLKATSTDIIGHLETKYFSEATEAFNSGVTTYNDIKSDVQTTVSNLLKTWSGEGKMQYKYDYDILYQQLEDIGDVLYELYDTLIEAEATYIKTDEQLAKKWTQ